MRRGTTPTHTFTLPIAVDNVSEALIVYAQSDEEILRKTVNHCRMDGNTLAVDLTQEETFLFDCKRRVQIQVRVLTMDGKALASNIITTDVDKCLSNEVLG
jgi:predicted small metal-binding protein